MFDVRCSVFDVQCSMFGVRGPMVHHPQYGTGRLTVRLQPQKSPMFTALRTTGRPKHSPPPPAGGPREAVVLAPLSGTLESTLSGTLSQAPSPLWLSFLGTLGTLARLNDPPPGERSFVCERGSAICHSAGHPLP